MSEKEQSERKELDSLVDKYIRKQLTLEEQQKFEERMKTDMNLAEEVKLRFDIMIGIRAAEQKMIRERLRKLSFVAKKNVDKNEKSELVETPLKIPKHVWIIGGIFIIVAIVVLLLVFWKK